ncbi:T3SS effector HopA1 family protein [Leadbetterella byssophila]|uniref:T3SS effector HopA1 family protein n=1 Tax=Leadbetterella byssophila TaxID=316068 RepID=UPI0039A21F2C
MLAFFKALEDAEFRPEGKTVRQLYELYLGSDPHKEKGNILASLNKLIKPELAEGRMLKPLDKARILAESNAEPLLLFPGEYLLRGTELLYYKTAYWHDKSFFYFFKNRTRSYPSSHHGRMYFNLTLRGALHALKALSQIPDHYFLVKCFYDASYFHRRDIIILTFPLFHFDFFLNWCKNYADQHPEHFREGVPYFLYNIRKGLGYGENPEHDKDSFGTQRVKVMKEFLDKGGSLNTFLRKKGYDPKAFYKNPGSPFSSLYEGW